MKTILYVTAFCLGATGFVIAQDPAPYTSAPSKEAPAGKEPGAAIEVINNLLKNGGFEYGEIEVGRPPNDWGFITQSGRKVNGGITEIAAHSGARSIGIGTPFASFDKWQVLAFNVHVQKSSKYEYTAWVKAYPDAPLYGGARGVIQIEWKDASGNEIDRLLGSSWGQKELSSGEWTQVKVAGQAPALASSASFVITYHLNPNMKSGGSFLVDDVVAVEIAK